MSYLQHIDIQLPSSDQDLFSNLHRYLSSKITLKDNVIFLAKSDPLYFPGISISSKPLNQPKVIFSLSNGNRYEVELVNKTVLDKKSPHTYTQIEFDDFIERMSPYNLEAIDHVGFDIPWFDGIHPEITKLRNWLKDHSLYYLFPSGEPWDFILPGKVEEIVNITDPDLTLHRQPKFEIVSIDKVSIPIIQIEINANIYFDEIYKLFPEAIAVPEVKCVWVYLKNNIGVDVCIVVNEFSGRDWSEFFKGYRLLEK